jgi:hypothetical protein
VERSGHGCTCLEGLRKSTKKTSVRIVGVRTKIRTRHRSQALLLCQLGLFIHSETGKTKHPKYISWMREHQG